MHKWMTGTALALGLVAMVPAAQAQDAAAGKEVFKDCMACHTVEAGKNRVGPSLAGVVGAKAGAVPGFRYSKAMQDKAAGGLTWDEATLKAYLMAPKEVVPGGSMAYAGLKMSPRFKADPEKAFADLAAYLKAPN